MMRSALAYENKNGQIGIAVSKTDTTNNEFVQLMGSKPYVSKILFVADVDLSEGYTEVSAFGAYGVSEIVAPPVLRINRDRAVTSK